MKTRLIAKWGVGGSSGSTRKASLIEMKRNKVRIRFEWFEPWFDKHKNFFSSLLAKSGFEVEVVLNKTGDVDLEFVSVYPPLKRDVQAKIHRLRTRLPVWQIDTTESYPLQFHPDTKNFKTRIWYTSENIRPPYQDDLDLFFSFDQDSYGGTNLYLPLWQLHLEHHMQFERPLNPNSALGIKVYPESLLTVRQIKTRSLSDKKFACAFVANPQPTRLRLIDELSSYGQVDVYGLYSGRPIPSKYEIAKQYNFVICPENDVYPGYVTEKLLDAYMCEAIPLYWGDLGSDEYINRKQFMNLFDYTSIQEFSRHVADLDFEKYRQIYEQPFLLNKVNFEGIRNALVSRLL